MDNKGLDLENLMEQVKDYIDKRLEANAYQKAKSVYLYTRISKEQSQELENLRFSYEVRSGKKIALSDIIRQEINRTSIEELRDRQTTTIGKVSRTVGISMRCTKKMKEMIIQWGIQLEVPKEQILYTIILLILEKERRGESAFADYIKSLQ